MTARQGRLASTAGRPIVNPLASLVLLVLLASSGSSDARPKPPSATAVQLLRAAGQRELAQGDLGQAARSLESAYRLRPDAEGLYWLCRLAMSQRRRQAAKDLARRYLAESTAGASSAGVRAEYPGGTVMPPPPELQQILALADEPAGELAVLGPPGFWVLVDGRMAGRLPLSLPLWVAAGSHQVTVETETPRVFVTQAEVVAGRMIELRVGVDADAVLITRVPSLLLLLPETMSATPLATRLQQTVAAAARRESLFLTDIATAAAPLPATACVEPLACLATLAERRDAAYVLELLELKEPPAAPESITLRLFAHATGDLVGSRSLRCPACSTTSLLAQLEPALAELLALATTRPRGELVLHSEPAAAEVFADGRRIGMTPYRRAAWAGRRSIELRRPGYLSWMGEVQIDDGQTTMRSVMLRPTAAVAADAAAVRRPTAPPRERMPEQRPRQGRPIWRLFTGGLAVAAGIVAAGFAASALVVDGQCSADTPATALSCRRSYASAPLGGALLGVGGVLVVGGGLLSLWPGPRGREPPLP